MFEISMGIMKGDSRSGPRSSRTRVLFGRGLQAADARTNENTDLIPIDPVQVQARVPQGLPGGVHPKLSEPVGAPHFLGGRKCRGRLEILDFARNLRVECGRIERLDLVYAALAGHQMVPERVEIGAQGRHDTQPGDHHPPFGPVACHKKARGSPS